MLNEPELIAYLDNTLSRAERQRVEAELERDPEQRQRLVRQIQLDAALRASLGQSAANERVKQSVLAVVRGESEATLKQHVLADTTFLSRGSRPEEAQASQPSSMLQLLSSFFRRPAWSFSLASACIAILVGVWFAVRPAPTTLALEMPTQVVLSAGAVVPHPGDTVRTEASASATVKFADGTILHLEPGTEIRFQAVANPPRAGGKQLQIISGSLSADVVKQPDGLPLLIQTPHALVTVVGTEFDLSVATNQTALEVTHGLVKMTRAGDAKPVSVAAGEFAVATPRAPMRYGRLARNPLLWPFSSTSVWNRPLRSDAKFAPVPGRSFLADGPLQNTVRPRRPFLGSINDPLRRIWVKDQVRADIRLPESFTPPGQGHDSIVLLQHARRFALELTEVSIRPDSDLDAADVERMPLNGPGILPGSTPAVRFGLSQLGGLLRAGELEAGIRHALSARISRDRLGGRNNFQAPSTVWPATGGDVPSDEFLSIGTLLAIPPDVDVTKLVGASGPAYELARAMQDYGVYVTGSGDAPFVLLADSAQIPDADKLLNQLVPMLQVVTNNSPATPAGGGTPRREPAPALPDESQ